MYYTHGYDNALKIIKESVKQGDNFAQPDKLTKDYNTHIQNISVFETPVTWPDIKIVDFEVLKAVAPTHAKNIQPHMATNTKILSEKIKSDFFYNALNQLKNNNEEMFSLVNLVIKMILINQLSSYTNGTTEKTIGLASMDFKDHFLEQDFIELVIHQLTHMLLFLDDRLSPHCLPENKQIMIETNEIKYRLGGTKFPAYLAFHSYLVGVEVLLFRLDYFDKNTPFQYHGSLERIIRLCKLFEKSLLTNINLFTPRGKEFLENASVFFQPTVAKI